MNLHSWNLNLAGIFTWAGKTSLEASVLILLVWTLQWLLRRKLAASWHYTLGLLIVLRLAWPIAPESRWSIFNLGHLISSGTAGQKELTPPVMLVLPAKLNVQTELPPPATLSLPDSPKSALPTLTPQNIMALTWLAGLVVVVVVATRQYFRLAREIGRQPELQDPRLTNLLAACQTELGMHRSIPVRSLPRLKSPALFGHLHPCLLIPDTLPQVFDDTELRLILLHELTHLKRCDILVNWSVIFLGALHWFNPLAWLAFRELRADQELACDAAVLARISADERRRYGLTLLKLLEQFTNPGPCPGLASFITHKPLIQRRINMITRFQPGGRIALAGSLALLTALGCFTFTRAEDVARTGAAADSPQDVSFTAKEKPAADPTNVKISGETKANFTGSANAQGNPFATSDGTKTRLQNILRRSSGNTDPLRNQDPSMSIASQGNEKIHQYESARIDAEVQVVRQRAILDKLRHMSTDELRQVLPTVTPDPLLTQLLQDFSNAETKLGAMGQDFGPEHPEIQRNERALKNLDLKIHRRIEGILLGMQTQVDSLQAVIEQTTKSIDEVHITTSQAIARNRQANDLRQQKEADEAARTEVADAGDKKKLAEANFNLMRRLNTNQRPGQFTVVMDEEGNARVGGEKKVLSLDDLEQRLIKALKEDPTFLLHITMNQATPSSSLSKIMELSQQLHISKMSLDVIAPQNNNANSLRR